MAIVIFAFFYKLFIPDLSIFITPDYGRSDSWHLSIANKFYYAQELKNNRIPIWNPKIGTGYPTLAEGQTGIFFSPNLIFFRLLPFVWAYNVSILFAFFTAATGTYFFCRSLRLNRLSSTYAGIIFSLGGFFIVHVQHHNLLQTATLMPWLFWGANEFLNKRKVIFLLALSFIVSQQIFAGFPQLTFYSFVALYSYIFFKTIFKKLPKIKLFSYLTASIIFGLLLSSIQLLPSYELLHISSKQTDPSTILKQFPYTYKNLLQFLDPFILGSPKDGSYPSWIPGKWGIYWESIAYIGIIPLSLSIGILIGSILKKGRRDIEIKIFAILLGLILGLTLGVNAPLHIIYSIPPFSLFRVPSRFLLIIQFSLVILASVYLYNISRRKILSSLIIAISVLNIFWVFHNYNPLGSAKKWFKNPETAEFLKGEDARILSFGHFERWTNYLLEHGWKETSFYLTSRESLDQNSNLIYSLNQFGAYESILTKRFSIIDSFINSSLKNVDNSQENIFKLLASQNIKYLITPQTIENSHITPVKESSFQNPFNIYQISFEPNRFYMVNNYQIVNTIQEVNEILNNVDFDPTKSVILEESLKESLSEGNINSQIDIVQDSPTKIVLNTIQDKDAILVIADSFYPGWTAKVDSQNRSIFPVNVNNRGLLLKEGNHKIEITYRSKTLITGFALSFISYLIFLPLLLKFKKTKIR